MTSACHPVKCPPCNPTTHRGRRPPARVVVAGTPPAELRSVSANDGREHPARARADDKGGSRTMPWTWRYEKADGTAITTDELQEAIFISQGDAESWLGENWRALLAVGVDQVTLMDDSNPQYGPMSLQPEDYAQIFSPG